MLVAGSKIALRNPAVTETMPKMKVDQMDMTR